MKSGTRGRCNVPCRKNLESFFGGTGVTGSSSTFDFGGGGGGERGNSEVEIGGFNVQSSKFNLVQRQTWEPKRNVMME